MNSSVKTSCPYCGVGCGVVATTESEGVVSIAGDQLHPANFGRLCSKGSDLANTLSDRNRLLTPMIDGVTADWQSALELVSKTLEQTIADYGPESVAFYVSGQLLTEDYYVVNKFVKGFLGTANIDTNSRLCMASSVAGHKRAFGSDTVPGCYEDIEQADLVILTGSNMAWCHPVLFQRMMHSRSNRSSMKICVIDPRRTATAELADHHLAIKPGTDAILFAGLMRYLDRHSQITRDYVELHTDGFDNALQSAQSASIQTVSATTELSTDELVAFYQMFANTRKVVTVYSQGINQSELGTDSVNSIINCHLATGRIGRPGMGPFSITGQPNAMGGREVGGLSNMLAAHMELGNASHRELVQEFWQSPRIASSQGLKAVDLFDSIALRKIRFVWIMATNPVDSLPMANTVQKALKDCPFVVVSDVVEKTDTARCAKVLLPAASWGEKEGTVTNSERCVSRQRAFRPLPGEARPDWWQITQVAQYMGYGNAFNYQEPSDIFREHAALSAYRNLGDRDFDIGAYQRISSHEYNELRPFYWPAPDQSESPDPKTVKRFFAQGRYFTNNGRARFVSVNWRSTDRSSDQFPMTLNTGRIRDQWHTMTRTGYSSRLNTHLAEPFVEIHPDDACRLGIGAAELVEVTSANGCVNVRALITDRQRIGSVFVPIHWSDQFASNARIDTLVSPVTDPVSGQPASKSEPVAVCRMDVSTYGFVLSRQPLKLATDLSYWAMAPSDAGWRAEFAGSFDSISEAARWRSFFIKSYSSESALVDYKDTAAGRYSLACFEGDRLQTLVFLAQDPVAVSRVWASEQFHVAHAHSERAKVVAGVASADLPDPGAIICSCHMVGSNSIIKAITVDGCRSVEAVGDLLNAGTNCGSCRGELATLLKIHAVKDVNNRDAASVSLSGETA